MNRILFLKLLESQIVNWTDSKHNQFLHPSKIDQYDQLETLFFEVLAKPVSKRTVRDFDNIPYLNSSLFEIHKDESDGITIATLADDLSIDYYSKTVAKNGGQRKTGKVSALAYLLEFLDAYDFSNESGDEIVSSAKSLISASVLGLIFEKINGYKDGSFYTPSFITMYMARESIQKTVIDKFNQANQWQCKTLTDIHNKDIEIVEANRIIDNIKICDPAVGSGHFLVSALNEILRIKSELGVLVDETGKRIKDHLSVENDELMIKNDDGELFEYKQGSSDKTRLQKTLFKEKQKIIENCLFGVDINPNSVNICRLRLWIELLKSAYYKDDGALDTLPNIDINIKCGNSLISRFSLSDDLNSKSIKTEMQEYKAKVKDYKENIGSKHEVIKAIEAIKAKFQHDLKASHSATKTLQDELKKYVREYDINGLNKELGFIAFDLKLPRPTLDMFAKQIDGKAKVKKLEEVAIAFERAKEIESGKIYQNAFEWRFEFPEVLNDEGEFVGFDVVIGNPPYFNIDVFGGRSAMLRYFPEHYPEIYMDKSDILFYFLALSSNISAKQTAFIISNAMLFSDKAKKLRNHLLVQNPIRKIINFEQYQVFDEASVTSMMLFLDKSHQSLCKVQNFTEPHYDKAALVNSIEDTSIYFDVQFNPDAPFALVNNTIATLNQKIDSKYPKLGDILHVGKGMETAANEVFSFDVYPSGFASQFVKKRMAGEMIERFTHQPAQDFLLYIEPVDEFENLPAEIQTHLITHQDKLSKRATVKNEGRIWWRYSRPMHKDYYQHHKIWCSYRAKENTFCFDESADFIGLTNTP